MKLYTLGCTGWFPNHNETCCFLVEHKGHLIMLDAGTGVSNLIHFQDVINKYDTLHVILTHYHLDHIVGLSYLIPFVHDKKLCIYGPGMPSYNKSTEEILMDFFQGCFFSRSLYQLAHNVKCFDYSDNMSFFIDTIGVNCELQSHSSPSFSIMIDNELLYVTDTMFDDKKWNNKKHLKVLLHECWQIYDDEKQNKHSSLESIMHRLPIKIFNKILLIHQNPLWSKEELDRIYSVIRGTNILLPKDLTVLSII